MPSGHRRNGIKSRLTVEVSTGHWLNNNLKRLQIFALTGLMYEKYVYQGGSDINILIFDICGMLILDLMQSVLVSNITVIRSTFMQATISLVMWQSQ